MKRNGRKKELRPTSCIPQAEIEYLMSLGENSSPYIVKEKLDELTEESLDYVKALRGHSELSKCPSYIAREDLCQSQEDYIKHTFYVSGLWNLQQIASIYNKSIDTLNDIDMECYPELWDLQEKVCNSVMKTYYQDKDLYYDQLGHLDIYNPYIEGMSSRDGMTSDKFLWME